MLAISWLLRHLTYKKKTRELAAAFSQSTTKFQENDVYDEVFVTFVLSHISFQSVYDTKYKLFLNLSSAIEFFMRKWKFSKTREFFLFERFSQSLIFLTFSRTDARND